MSYPIDEMISDLEIANEDLTFGENLPRGIRGCTLSGCNIAIDVPKGGPSIYRCKLTDCTISVKRPIKDSSFFNSDYLRCKFKGKFEGVDFGKSPRPNPLTGELDEYGEMVDCDFTEATLDMCRFFSVDVAKQKFAPWPQFVIPYANELAASKLSRDWPGKFGTHMRLVPRQNPALVATTGTVADYLEEYGLSLEELEQVLQAIGGVMR